MAAPRAMNMPASALIMPSDFSAAYRRLIAVSADGAAMSGKPPFALSGIIPIYLICDVPPWKAQRSLGLYPGPFHAPLKRQAEATDETFALAGRVGHSRRLPAAPET